MPKLGNRLTESAIKSAKPKDKPYKLMDQYGLRLLIRPTGKKIWQVQYTFNSKQNTFTIGEYGRVTSTEARKQRDDIRDLIKQGIDPNQKKHSDKLEKEIESNHTFEKVGRDWYSKQSWAEKHAKNINSRLEKDVYCHIGRKPINDINVREMQISLKELRTEAL